MTVIDKHTLSIRWKEMRKSPDGSMKEAIVSYGPNRAPLPASAPSDAHDLAAQHWTPEVIEAAKAKAAARPRVGA
jgi:hypothetical protein